MHDIFHLTYSQLLTLWVVSVVIGIPMFMGYRKNLNAIKDKYPDLYAKHEKSIGFRMQLWMPIKYFNNDVSRNILQARLFIFAWNLIMVPMAVVFIGNGISGNLQK